MQYLRVRWLAADDNQPTWAYLEIDDSGAETRRVEVFAPARLVRYENGEMSHEARTNSSHRNTDVIDASEFERLWNA